MKKIFSMLLLVGALFATSCDSDDETTPDVDYVGEKYVGSIDAYVIPVVVGSQNVNVSIPAQDNVTIYFDVDDDVAQFTFAQTTFTGTTISTGYSDVTGMPKLDIVLPNIPMTAADTYYATDVTPKMLDGDTFSDATIQGINEVAITVDEQTNAITAVIECDLLISMGTMGEQSAVIELTYNGTKAE